MTTGALFRLGDAAEEAGDYERAQLSFEKGAALGDVLCLMRLAYMFDVGVGVEPDKVFAMRCYQRAWRREPHNMAANNIAILYREAGNRRAMFKWFQRALVQGDYDALVDLAQCHLKGLGVRRSVGQALRCLSAALASESLFEATREKAEAMLAELRPKLVEPPADNTEPSS